MTQPRISHLMRGKIELFGLDTLVNMIGAAGLHIEMRISDAAWSAQTSSSLPSINSMNPIIVGWVERAARTLVRSGSETHRRAAPLMGFRKRLKPHLHSDAPRNDVEAAPHDHRCRCERTLNVIASEARQSRAKKTRLECFVARAPRDDVERPRNHRTPFAGGPLNVIEPTASTPPARPACLAAARSPLGELEPEV
jgi:hypothetical protein